MRVEEKTLELSAEEGARVVALGLLAEATEAAEQLAAGTGDEPLHDFRVAVRRLRSALRSFRPWLEQGVRPRHEKRLKRIAGSTNEARDAEVQLAWLAAKREEVSSPSRRPGYACAVARFEGRVHGAPDAARVAARFHRLADKLRHRLGRYERRVVPVGEEPPAFAVVLASLVAEHVSALAAQLTAIRDAGDQETAHRARIEGKRLRYLLEPLRGCRQADAAEAVAHLKRLQDVLWELHDAHVLAAELGAALADVAADRARRAHAATLAPGARGPVRDALRGSPRPGLLALLRLVRDRRDALFAELERAWRPAGMDALAAEVRALAAALEARAGGKLEHERKFLLARLPAEADGAPSVEIAQGWLPGSRLRERVRRVRRDGVDRYFRAVKRGAGGSRLEVEEETTREVFDVLWPLTAGRRVTKRRHEVPYGPRTWEIDAFTDRELFLAEVELPAGETEVPLPDWLRPLVLREVTDDPAFLNENLATAPAVGATENAAPASPEPAPATSQG